MKRQNSQWTGRTYDKDLNKDGREKLLRFEKKGEIRG